MEITIVFPLHGQGAWEMRCQLHFQFTRSILMIRIITGEAPTRCFAGIKPNGVIPRINTGEVLERNGSPSRTLQSRQWAASTTSLHLTISLRLHCTWAVPMFPELQNGIFSTIPI